MSVIIYGGTKKQIERQFSCRHDWHGPCIDEMSRYFKCKKCFCLERDMTEAEYYREIKLITEPVEDRQDGNGRAA